MMGLSTKPATMAAFVAAALIASLGAIVVTNESGSTPRQATLSRCNDAQLAVAAESWMDRRRRK